MPKEKIGLSFAQIHQPVPGMENFLKNEDKYVQMMVERYHTTRKDHKYFLIGLSIGFMPYIVHMNQWL